MQKPITPIAPVQSSRAASDSACGFDLVVGPAVAGSHIAHDRDDAGCSSSPMEEIGRRNEVSLAREPIGLVPQILVHPEDVVDDDDSRPRALARRRGHVQRKLSARDTDH